MSFLFMPASKIIFSDDDYKFMIEYKKAHGVSIQHFVTTAIQDQITKLKAEQFLKDEPYTQKDATIH